MLAIIVLAGAGMIVHVFYSAGIDTHPGTNTATGNASGNAAMEEICTYIDEVDYTGADVPFELYNYPFEPQNASDVQIDNTVEKDYYYVSNKELSKSISSTEINKYVEDTSNFIHNLFEDNYRTLLFYPDTYQNNIIDWYGGDKPFIFNSEQDDTTVSDFAAEIRSWYVDNWASVDVEFQSDHSLVYKKYLFTCVRGALTLKVNSSSKPSSLLGMEFNEDNQVSVIVEVSYDPVTNKVARFDILDYID